MTTEPERGMPTAARRLAPLAVVSLLLPPIGAALLIGYLSRIGPWLQSLGGRGVALYVAGFAVLGGFALLPTYAPAILGGWAFGDRVGLPAALAGFALAAGINYAWARWLSADHAAAALAERPRWLTVRNALVGQSWWKTLLVVALVRVPPNSPFALSNAAMAAARVVPGAYLLGTLIGLAPRTAVAVRAGSHLSTLDFSHRDAFGSVVVTIVVSVAVLGVLGWLARRALDSAIAAHAPAADTDTAPRG
ncbi:MAG: VTT domain-containing protein [Acidobacteria bacterium]|nr:VTT domain-containing protein [Acidobacteriota bacterium]